MNCLFFFINELQNCFAVDIDVLGAGHNWNNGRHLQIPTSQSFPGGQSCFPVHYATGLRHHVCRGNNHQFIHYLYN